MEKSESKQLEVIANNQDIIENYDKFLKNHLGCLSPEFARAHIVLCDAKLEFDEPMVISMNALLNTMEAYRNQLKDTIALLGRRRKCKQN